ncbi:MAG: WD40 repeat protein [Gammaproteobacteria bacterium]
MGTPHHQRLAEIFGRVVDLPASERDALLVSLCKDSNEREEVEALLGADARDGLLPRADEGPSEIVADALRDAGVGAPSLDGLPDEIGRYAIQRELGSGAMGRVLLARQMCTDQLVALKLIRPEITLTTPKALDRFEQETKILGRLSHPGIARILDAGSARIGGHDQPYLAIEYVPGRHLMDFAREEELDLNARINLLAQLCDAVQHAHDHGVVHRDLKPDNVIVTADGQPKVLDFGVARITDAESHLTTIRTSGGQLIGTLAYMSPEQASGGALALDGRSDVYALGVLGFELLTGHRPHDLTGLDFVAAARVICESDPARLTVIAPSVPRDVATILYKALSKEADGRYPTASALAQDLRRFVRNEPILARPASGLYVMKKLARRHRGLTVGLLVALGALITGTVVSSVLAVRAMHSAEVARWQAYLATLAAASSEVHAGSHESASRRLGHSPIEHRGIEWRILSNLAQQSTLTLLGHGFNVWTVAIAPDGSRAYSGAGDGTVRVWDLELGTEIAILDDHDDRVFCVAASRNGSRMASGSADMTVRLRDAASLETIAVLEGHQERVFGLAFSDDGSLLATGAGNGSVRLWRSEDGGLVRIVEDNGPQVWSIAFSPDGARMVTVYNGGMARVHDVASGDRLATLNTGSKPAVDVSFHPDGTRFAVATTAGELQLWDIDTLQRVASVQASTEMLGCVEFAPDGTCLVTGARDGSLSIWDSDSLTRIAERIGHSDWIQALAFSADGRRLVSGSWDDSVRVWDGPGLHERTAPLGRTGVHFLKVSDASPTAAFIAPAEGSIELRDLLTGSVEQTATHEPLALDHPSDASLCRIYESGTLELRCEIMAFQPVVHPDGLSVAATPMGSSGCTLFDSRTGEIRATFGPTDIRTRALAFDPSGQLLAVSGFDDCAVRIYEVPSGRLRAVLEGHVDAVTGAAFNTAGTRLITCGDDRTAYLWDAHTFERLGALSGHGAKVTCASFSPDGTRVATATMDGKVRFWSLEPLELLVVLPVDSAAILQLEFALDGTVLLARTETDVLFVLDGR